MSVDEKAPWDPARRQRRGYYTDEQMEAEMMGRLLVKLGASETQAKAAVANPVPGVPTAERARVISSSAGAALEVDDGLDRAWRRVGIALDRSGFTVEDRDRAARAEAELANFRTRVERDRAANREANIAEVIRTLLPAIDDLDRAESHGDLAGSPLELVAQKLRSGFERYGLKKVGEIGEPFDPNRHEALVQLPKPDVTSNVIGDVIEVGYVLGDRLVRAAKVAVFTPEG